MAANRGKQFENVIRQAFENVPNVSVDRLHDQTTKYKGTSANICDFIVYKEPYEYYIECKTVHGNVLPFTNISNTQWNGLLEKSKIEGVRAGIICWWIDRDVTRFLPIRYLVWMKQQHKKSIRFDNPVGFKLLGRKKRVFYAYDMEAFFNEFV